MNWIIGHCFNESFLFTLIGNTGFPIISIYFILLDMKHEVWIKIVPWMTLWHYPIQLLPNPAVSGNYIVLEVTKDSKTKWHPTDLAYFDSLFLLFFPFFNLFSLPIISPKYFSLWWRLKVRWTNTRLSKFFGKKLGN